MISVMSNMFTNAVYKFIKVEQLNEKLRAMNELHDIPDELMHNIRVHYHTTQGFGSQTTDQIF